GFTTVAGLSRNRLARLNSDGTLDAGFTLGAGFNSTVYALRLIGGSQILVGGAFTTYQGATANRIVRLLSNGTTDSAFVTGNGFNSVVYALDTQTDGRILAGGAFGGYGVTQRLAVARLLSDGSLDTSFVPLAFSYAVIAIGYLNDGSVLVGGGFSSLGTSTAQFGIARLLATGTAVVNSFGPGLFSPGSVARAMPVAGGKIIAAGAFTHVNGTARGNLARLNGDGSLDLSYNSGAGANAAVSDAVARSNGAVVLAGAFTSLSGYPRVRHVRMLSEGSLDGTFGSTAGPNATPSRVAVLPDGRVLLLGSEITDYDNVSRSGLVLVTASGSLDNTFNANVVPAAGSLLSAAVQSDSKILVAGAFTSFANAHRSRLVRLLPSGAIDSAFVVDVDDTVRSVAVQADGKILIAGDFLVVNHTPRARVARLLSTGALDPSFNPDFTLSDSPTQLFPQADGRVLLSGPFTAVSNSVAAAFLVRLRADGALDTTFCAPGLSASPADVAVMDDGSLLLAGGEFQLGGVWQFGLARTVSTFGPNILAQPLGGSTVAGTPLVLTMSVAGGLDVSYQWLKNGAPLPGATSPTYSVASVQASDSGSYVVRVTHGGGTFDSSATSVSVTPSLPLLSPTAGAISGFGGAIKSGSRWALVAPVPLAATAPITYQWTKNGSSLVGATNRVLLPGTWQDADSGAYQVTLGNSVGTTTTTPFQQSVTSAPDWAWRVPTPQGNSLVKVAYLNGRFLAGGVRGTVLSSADGETWETVRLGVSQTVFAFAFGNSTYVALTSFSGLWTSPDTLTWTQRDTRAGADGSYFSAITFGLGRFVAVGGGGLIATSTEGKTWTSVVTNTTEPFSAVTFGGGKFIALGTGGRTYVSSDGVIWSTGAVLPRPVTMIVFGVGKFVAAVDRFAFVSVDGVTWTRTALNTNVGLRSLQYSPDGFRALLNATDGSYYTSTDAVTWTFSFPSYADGTAGLVLSPSDMVGGGGRNVIVGAAPQSLVYSTLGQAWQRPGPPTALGFTAAASDAAGLMAVTSNGWALRITPNEPVSLAQGWSSTFSTAVADIAYGVNTFVAVGAQGQIGNFSTGPYWQSRSSGTTNDLKGVTFLADRFYAVGINGTLLVSADGASWSARTSGTTQSLGKVAYGAGVYVAVGAAGTVIGSSDSITWSPRTVTGVTSTINDVIFADGKFVLVSEGGSIRTSPDGTTWTSRLNPLGAGLKTVVHGGGKFYAFTTGNTNYLTSPDGVTWTPAQHGNANTAADAVVAGNKLYLVGANASIVSLPLDVPAPVLATAPAGQTFVVGGTGSLTVALEGAGPFAYQWFKNGAALVGANFATLTFANISAADAGSYTVAVTSAGGTTTSAPAVVTIESRGLLNTAARANVGTGAATLTGAFTIEGPAPKQMLVRAAGPALTVLGVTGALADPQLVIEDLATGAVVASNDDWGQAANLTALT
ncbi:MAG: hypothetical protein Q8M65_01400, partial [Rhodoglobus sp.]|nr:hypothetical protein [Rhodoglobus sp.]